MSLPLRSALRVLLPGFLGTELPGWLADLLRQGLGGVCLFGANVSNRRQLVELTAAIRRANPEAVIAIDEEGGDVSRLYQHQGSPFPGNAVLGRINDLPTTRAVAHRVGSELAQLGIRLTLAPDVDVNSNELNPVIGVRSFGADPDLVAAHSAAWTEGVQAAGVAACAKHFPGHGDTATDSHLAEPVILADSATIAAREFPSFRAAISAGTRTVMTSHIRVPALDPDQVATFSSIILDDILRGQLGFTGAVITDALDMHGASGEIGISAAAVRALGAGADLLCLGSKNPPEEILAIARALAQADRYGVLPAGRLTAAGHRCDELVAWMLAQPEEAVFDHDPLGAAGPSPATVANSFQVSERATALLEAPRTGLRWVELSPQPNIAIGATPFGPFFASGARPSLRIPVEHREVADGYQAGRGELTVIVGRELQRDDAALQAARRIARSNPSIIVDMGYARPDLVDIATFGASRLVGQALIEYLGG